jgi:hypothetical protein
VETGSTIKTMKKILKEWHKYLKEQKEIQDYADVPGLTAKESPGVTTFTYDGKPDKYAASREWLKQAAEEFFGGVKSDLEGKSVLELLSLENPEPYTTADYYPELEDPGPHDMLPSMNNRDFDEATRAATIDAFLEYDDFGQMSYTEKIVARHKELMKYLHPGSQQYQDTKYYIDKYTPIAEEEKAGRLQMRAGYPAGE